MTAFRVLLVSLILALVLGAVIYVISKNTSSSDGTCYVQHPKTFYLIACPSS